MITLDDFIAELLLIDEGILSAAFVDYNGQAILTKSKYHIKIGFDSSNMIGLWMRAAFAMIEQCSKTFGNISTFVTSYETIKVAVWPDKDIGMLILLVLLPSTNVEYVFSKIRNFLTAHKDLFSDRRNADEQSDKDKWITQ